MAHFGEATFEIISQGRTCPVYDDPDTDDEEDPFTRQKYIEVVTGATFKIRVTLDPDFVLHSCDAIRVAFCFDNAAREYFTDIARDDVLAHKAHRARMGSIVRYCPSTGHYQRGELSFGSLEIHEGSSANVSPDQLKAVGFVQIKEKPVGYHMEGIPLPGKAGQRVKMNVLYRSKKTLQLLGCIPRSPSPALVSGPTGTSDSAGNADLQEELTALRARLAELERQASGSSQTNIKSEQPRGSSAVKRERDDNEEKPQQKRRRQSRPVETIDLTDD
ncbi:MAG: hypothetical protein L6R39_001708 [Caloplaca ligustica]|nr:MAG: hypothetical protein L6R39_001708 [Caloplaca ligustica]